MTPWQAATQTAKTYARKAAELHKRGEPEKAERFAEIASSWHMYAELLSIDSRNKTELDWVAIERAMAEDPTTPILTSAERRLVVEKLTKRGWTNNRIALAGRMSVRTVMRYKRMLEEDVA